MNQTEQSTKSWYMMTVVGQDRLPDPVDGIRLTVIADRERLRRHTGEASGRSKVRGVLLPRLSWFPNHRRWFALGRRNRRPTASSDRPGRDR